jgi:histone acetyltransferase (RNA polymerase elongator complex component)
MTSSPIIIPVFLPFLGCRERCVFCNQRATGGTAVPLTSLRKHLKSILSQVPPKGESRQRQIAFYGGSFTALDPEIQILYLKEVQPFLEEGSVDSIRISTRPDALAPDLLPILRRYGTKTVEIGAQSMIEEVLSLAHRGHSAEDTARAISRLKQEGFEVGLQLMMGLPGDSRPRFLQTLDRIIELQPDFVRIHPTLVVKDAPLESLWRSGRYTPLSMDDMMAWLKPGLLKLERAAITVARVGLQPTEELEDHYLAGPYHPSLRHLVDSAIAFDMAASLIADHPVGLRVVFFCHPGDDSIFRGQKNDNLLKLRARFQLEEVSIQSHDSVPRGSLVLQRDRANITIRRTDLRYEDTLSPCPLAHRGEGKGEGTMPSSSFEPACGWVPSENDASIMKGGYDKN